MNEPWLIFLAGVLVSGIVSYFTAHSTVLSRMSTVEANQRAQEAGHQDMSSSINRLGQSIDKMRTDLGNQIKDAKEDVLDEIRTYYQRKQ